jgi:hypothetical protein
MNERTNERQDTHVGIEGVAFPLEHKRRWLRFAAPIHPLVMGHAINLNTEDGGK